MNAFTTRQEGTRPELARDAQARADLLKQSIALCKIITQAHESLCLGNYAEALGYIEAAAMPRVTLAHALERETRRAMGA